jgi:hypothetical protein
MDMFSILKALKITGYDGVFGRIEIFGGEDREESTESKSSKQMTLF